MFFTNAPLQTPTTKEISDFIVNDYISRNNAPNLLSRAIVRFLAWGIAPLYVLLFRFGRWGINQIFIQTADEEAINLQGNERGLSKNLGNKSVMKAHITGATALQIDAGTLYQYNSVVYNVISNVPVNSGSAIVSIEAPEIGSGYDIVVGQMINLVNPLIGIPETAIITEITVEGTDDESFESWQQRVLNKTQLPPQGMAPADLLEWATDVTDIVDCYVYVYNANVSRVIPITTGSGADRIPSTAQLNAVEQSCIRSEGSLYDDRLQLGSELDIITPDIENYSVTITGLTPADTGIYANIKSQIINYLDKKRASNPAINKIGVITRVDKNEIISIVQGILNVYAGNFSTLTFYFNMTEITGQRFLDLGTIAVLNTLTINGIVI